MGYKIEVPGMSSNMKEIKRFCEKNQIPTRNLSPTKWYMVLKRMDLPDEGGLMDAARLPVFRAAMKG
jgi:hypothetical protein